MSFEGFLSYLKSELSNSFDINKDKINFELLFNDFGDLTTKFCFYFKNPLEMAKKVVSRFPKHEYISKVENKGPYINIFLSDKFYQNILKEFITKEIIFDKKDKQVIIEYPSVNPNKPWHIGHLRNALIGDSLSKIYSFLGYNVIRLDYIDDLGLQIAQSLYGLETFGCEKNMKFDHLIGIQYVKVAKMLPKIKDEIERILIKMEQGNNEISKKARKLAEDVVKAQYETAFKFKIFHDYLVFESDIIRELYEDGIKLLKKNNFVYLCESGKNKGCWVVDINEKNLKSNQKVLIRSNGTITYAGKDLIFHLWKIGVLKKPLRFTKFLNAKKSWIFGEQTFFNADIIVNVIGIEQTLPQKIIKDILLKFKQIEFYHVPYEHALVSGNKLSGRKGTWIGYSADDLFQEVYNKCLLKSKSKEIAEKVALSAIKFYFLKTSNSKKVIFDWKRALSLEGDSGPYLLYSYVRAKSILQKCTSYKHSFSDFIKEEKLLIKTFLKFSSVVERSKKENDPHFIADYCLELSRLFNKFYSSCPILSGKEHKHKRLAIVETFSKLLQKNLELLGIETLDKM